MSKNELQGLGAEVKNKTRFSKTLKIILSVLLITTVLLVGFTLMLFDKPEGYEPLTVSDPNEVSRHLSHYIAPTLYNNLQTPEPFELVLTQEAVSDMVARGKWPKEIGDGLTIFAPRVYFADDVVILMSLIELAEREMVLTVVGKAWLDEQKLLNLNIEMIKLGSINIRRLAMSIAADIYEAKLTGDADSMDDQTKTIAEALLLHKAIRPEFEYQENKALITDIKIEQTRMTLTLSGR